MDQCAGSGELPMENSRKWKIIGNASVATHGRCRKCFRMFSLTTYGYVRAHKEGK